MNTMPGPSNGGRTGNNANNKKKDGKLVDTMRGACPPHRRKDLDSLIKLFNGDEEKIQAKIQEWWEEPQEEEEKWEDVNKKGAKAKVVQKAPFVSRGGGGGGRAPGRGGRASRGAGGGRGGKDLARTPGREGRGGRDGAERRTGGRGGRGTRSQERDTENEPRSEDTAALQPEEQDKETLEEAVAPVDVPTTAAPAPKGAWSVRATAAAAAAAELHAPIPEAKPTRPVPQAHPEPVSTMPPPVETRPSDIAAVANHLDAAASLSTRLEVKPVKTATATSGNVWATKGSAHLIQAEKPKVLPPPAPLPPPPQTQLEQPINVPMPVPQTIQQETPMETLMPPHATPNVPAWTSPAKSAKQIVEIPPSPVVAQPPLTSMPTVSAVEETIITEAPQEIPVAAAPKPIVKTSVVSLPTNVLNMGHWETGEDDSQHLDFGFGSFGPESDVGMMDQATGASALNAAESATGMNSNSAQNSVPPALSPARPPPGLSISGMPPIPANAVLVHELENSLENTSLNPQPDHGMHQVSDRSMPNAMPPTSASGIMSSQHHQPTGAPVLPQQNYGQYSMAGVYGYGSAGNGFMGVPAPVLAGGVIPQKPQQPPSAGGIAGQQQQLGSGVGISLAQPQHSGLYGSTGPSSAGSSQIASDTDTSAATAPIPPSIPGGAMPYNPVYYGQQPFHHMGQPQGVGYNYGYGAAQFGGAGGFGYQQVMGQSGAYHAGAPPYEDQTHATGGAHHAGSAGGYQKTAGYRGRHSGGQYQNQYNPPSGYGGQPPYGMGYGVDHFNQRGVNYGPQGAMDPYMQQQQQQQQQQGNAGAYPSGGMHRGNFQDEDQYKKKGGRNNNNTGSNLQQQFPPQQQHNPNATPSHLGQQQQQHSFGLPQSGAAPSSDIGSSTGGWSNHHGGGGWGGGVPSWQGS